MSSSQFIYCHAFVTKWPRLLVFRPPQIKRYFSWMQLLLPLLLPLPGLVGALCEDGCQLPWRNDVCDGAIVYAAEELVPFPGKGRLRIVSDVNGQPAPGDFDKDAIDGAQTADAERVATRWSRMRAVGMAGTKWSKRLRVAAGGTFLQVNFWQILFGSRTPDRLHRQDACTGDRCRQRWMWNQYL